MKARWALSGAACGVAATLVIEVAVYRRVVLRFAERLMG